MNISDIRIRLVTKDDSKLKAVASITIEDSFVVHDIKVIEGNEGCFVAMPSRRDENGVFRDIIHPITAEARIMLEDHIIEAYNRHIAELELEESNRDTADAEDTACVI